MNELRAGIVGAGMIANAHANAYQANDGVAVVAIADPVPLKVERLAERVGAKAVGDLAELLDVGVDVVSVRTPPTTHAELAVTALEAGKHVLCEKPLARTLPDARRIVQAGKAAPGVLMVGHVSRFEPDHRKAKELVAAGEIGAVQMMSHSITTPLPGWSEAGWFSRPEMSGGPVVDLAVHGFDYLSWIADSPPVRVHAVGRDTFAGETTYALVTVHHASGAIGLVETSWAHPAARGFKVACELVGTEGRIAWDYDHLLGGAIYRAGGDTRWLEPLGDRGYVLEMRTFLDSVRDGGPSPVPAEDAYDALRTSLAALESIATGEPVDLTTWETL